MLFLLGILGGTGFGTWYVWPSHNPASKTFNRNSTCPPVAHCKTECVQYLTKGMYICSAVFLYQDGKWQDIGPGTSTAPTPIA